MSAPPGPEAPDTIRKRLAMLTRPIRPGRAVVYVVRGQPTRYLYRVNTGHGVLAGSDANLEHAIRTADALARRAAEWADEIGRGR